MNGEWIPASKGMPDNGKNVLVFVAVPGRSGGTITVANHIDDRTEEASDETLGYVDEWAVYDEDTDTFRRLRRLDQPRERWQRMTSTHLTPFDLVYADASPDYCLPQTSIAHYGTCC